ncbi:MAG: helix-turn-helix domain-containing protein [Hydrogeniiclostridium mannosilyticum]
MDQSFCELSWRSSPAAFLSARRSWCGFPPGVPDNPYAYLLEKRMAFSVVLLRNTALSVAEIAEKLQFHNAHYFSSAFKKAMGVSPTALRKQTDIR